MRGTRSNCIKWGKSSLKYDPNIVKIGYRIVQNAYYVYKFCMKKKIGMKYIRMVTG